MIDFVVFAVVSTGVAAAGLALLPNLCADHIGFGNRFLYFLWRCCLPILAFEEIVLRVFNGHFYP